MYKNKDVTNRITEKILTTVKNDNVIYANFPRYHDGWPIYALGAGIATGVLLLFLAFFFNGVVARKATMFCPVCGLKMIYKEFNYPADSLELSNYNDIINGANGRLYAQHHANTNNQHGWFNHLYQGARLCEGCQRHVITEKMIKRFAAYNAKKCMALEKKTREAEG